MLNVDFLPIKDIIRDPEASNNDAENSPIYSQLTYVLSNLIEKTKDMTEKELGMFTISLQYWCLRRQFTYCKEQVNIGDVFMADLGIGYNSETAYNHPVIILEEIGNLLLVVPTSSSPSKVSRAYHPDDNPDGHRYWRKIKISDGFECDSAVLMGNIISINPGRLLNKLCTLKMSLFREIKENVFNLGFPKLNADFIKLIDQYQKLENKNKELKKEIEKLKKEL